MKESVWYNAIQDEVIVRLKNGRVQRGCQATIGCPAMGIEVRDHLSLFTFGVKKDVWRFLRDRGWLIRLGDL